MARGATREGRCATVNVRGQGGSRVHRSSARTSRLHDSGGPSEGRERRIGLCKLPFLHVSPLYASCRLIVPAKNSSHEVPGRAAALGSRHRYAPQIRR